MSGIEDDRSPQKAMTQLGEVRRFYEEYRK